MAGITKNSIFKECALCGSSGNVEMHHLRSVKDVRMKIRTGVSTFQEREGAFLRKQVPPCKYHHNLYHRGELFGYEMNTIRNYSENTPTGLIEFSKSDSGLPNPESKNPAPKGGKSRKTATDLGKGQKTTS